MLSTMQGKTVLVTGATAGIGLETAYQLAASGSQVILVSRNEQKCAAQTEKIKQKTGSARVSYIAADLSTMAGVRKTAYEFKKAHTRLDVLINNVGALFMSRQLSADQIEMTFALNHLGTFHLTHLLLDVLKATGSARVINLSSNEHRGQTLNFDDLQNEHHYNGLQAYGQSKLCNILFVEEFARRMAESNVTANAVHPGFVASNFAKNNGLIYRIGMNLLRPFIRTVRQGAETVLYVAASHEIKTVSGQYFANKKMVSPDPAADDLETAARLWDASLEMVL